MIQSIHVFLYVLKFKYVIQNNEYKFNLAMPGHLSVKNDVYSFGVVLLELLSGRRALDEERCSAEETLVDWAKPFLNERRKISRIMDTRLEGQYAKKEAQAIAALALQCLHTDPKNRPIMTEVLATLEQLRSSKDMMVPRIYSRK